MQKTFAQIAQLSKTRKYPEEVDNAAKSCVERVFKDVIANCHEVVSIEESQVTLSSEKVIFAGLVSDPSPTDKLLPKLDSSVTGKARFIKIFNMGDSTVVIDRPGGQHHVFAKAKVEEH